MAASFSMTGQVRLSPQWTDELNATDVIDATSIIESFALTDGTGNGQANCYWKDVRTVAAGQEDAIDLASLPLKAYGGTATIGLTSLRAIYIRNLSSTLELTYRFPDNYFGIVAGGVFLWVAPRGATAPAVNAFDIGSKALIVWNNNASAINYEIILVGVKA